MTFVRAVLFAKGTGADASSYQPNRDESQWWNRRDALVRCLVLLFEDDWSRMHMTYVRPSKQDMVPKEQTIVALWKKAAQQKQPVQENGLTCQLYKNNTKGTSNVIPSNLESKRDVLEHLQATCSIEFLREKGLNSSSQVLLRKLNKQTLTEIGKEWNARHAKTSDSGASSNLTTLGPILEQLLQPVSRQIQTIVAVTLHESSHHELPCWNQPRREKDDGETTQTCIFLGAVRDMTPEENKCLQQTCQKLSIPQTAVRLGPVPEFTSKILSVVAYHHAHHQLWPALQTLLRPDDSDPSFKKRPRQSMSQTKQPATQLHFVSIVPFPSTFVTTELNSRDRSLWCLVRSVVASLWRSRLAGTHDSNVSNTLTLWFMDGQYLLLQQDELVTLLAEKHQAAPTEFQILQAIRDQLSTKALKPREDCATAILSSILSSSDSTPRFLLDLDMAPSSLCLTDLMYNFFHDDETSEASCGGAALVLFSMQSADDLPYCRQERALFREASQMKQIPVLPCSLRETVFQDFEASTITMLQQFCYQGLFFSAIQQKLSESSSKREKKSKKKRRNTLLNDF